MNANILEDLNFYLKNDILYNIVSYVSKLIVVLLYFVICYILTRFIVFLLRKLFLLTKIDTFIDYLNTEIFKEHAKHFKASEIVITVIKYFVIIVFVLIGAELLQFDIVSKQLAKFLGYLPQFFAGLAILLAGTYFGNLVRKKTINTTAVLELSGGKILGQFLFVIIICFTVITALDQIGIDTSFITNNISIILASFFASLALAFGLGAKDVVQKILYIFYTKKVLRKGDRITVNNITGTITSIDNLCVMIKTESRERIVIPVSEVMNNIINITKDDL